MAICISIVGKDNAPLYFSTSDMEKELELQYRVHAALDVVEEKCQPSNKGTSDSKELYLGLLYSTEANKMWVT
ncbi:trafficking protein particle complex subunit 2-like protein [Teleopsis dalmanni]|uniref:trafficking protein particle complex subunit 2-like protein n=1 Tax=Teleopsis dalmanni TaxID=139649 RepID=UPI000D32C360|nr:trafficking protein particle complex subunit 2-like protein [Teleopsis dalmanni]